MIVLDETLLEVVNILEGLKEDGSVFINSTLPAEAFRKRPGFDKVKNLVTIDATAIALQEVGANIVNTIMMGAAVGGTDLVTPEAMAAAIDGSMSPSLREKNKKVTQMAYDIVKGGMAK